MGKMVLALFLVMVLSASAFAQRPATESLPSFVDLDVDKDNYISMKEIIASDVLVLLLDINKNKKLDWVEFDKLDVNKDGKLDQMEYGLIAPVAKPSKTVP